MNDWFFDFTDSNFYEESNFSYHLPFGDELISIDFDESTTSLENYGILFPSSQQKQEEIEYNEKNESQESSSRINCSHAQFFFIRTMGDCRVINNYINELEKQGYSYEIYQFECVAAGIMIIVSYDTEIDVEYID